MSGFNHLKFLSFEKEHNLFELHKKGFKYWDIIRFDIYLELLWDYRSKEAIGKSSLTNYFNLFIDYLAFLKVFLFKKVDYVFFASSRNRTSDGLFYDQNMDDVMRLYPSHIAIFESSERDRSKRLYTSSFYNPLGFFRRLILPLLKEEDYSDVLKLIQDTFGRSVLDNFTLNYLINSFKIDKVFYHVFLYLKRPKVIFITQNGIQKGLFAAAERLNIPVVEFQHGIIDEGHLAYNYNSDINYDHANVFLPTVFFTFTNFWTRGIFFPIKSISSIGNTAFNRTGAQGPEHEDKTKHGLVVASSDVFGEDLKNLIIKFVELNKDIPVYFKLHPNQFGDIDKYKADFKLFDNVIVISNEKSIYDLLLESDSILAIQSTALYEGLHLQKKAIIYKRQSYTRHRHIFNLPNVFLVDSAADVRNAVLETNNGVEMYSNLFFQQFDKNKFHEVMKLIVHEDS